MGWGQSNIAHSSQAVGEGLRGRIEGSTERVERGGVGGVQTG